MNKSQLLGAAFTAALALVLTSTPALSATLIWSGGATTTDSDPGGNL